MKQSLSTQKHANKYSVVSLFPYLKYKRIYLGFLLVLLLLVITSILSFTHTKPEHILSYLQNVEVLSFRENLYVTVNDTLLDTVIPSAKCQKLSTSLDGRIAVFLTDNKELYIVEEQEIKKIADDVLHFEISPSGQGVAFAQKYADQNALTLFNLKEETRREITTLLSSLDFSLSPDGQTLAYYTEKDKNVVLMCYQKGHSSEICTDESDLVGLSNDGKYIFAVCPASDGSSCLYSFNSKGHASELGPVTSISFKFNQDHRQIMFYNNGKTLISVNGEPSVMASSYPLYLVTAGNSQSTSDGNSITLPVTTLFNHIYTCSDGEATSAWLIRRDADKSEKIATRVSGCSLDASAKYLYFIQDHSKLCMMNVENGISKIHILAENADNYAVTGNRKRVYYVNEGSIFCTSGRKSTDSKLIFPDFTGYNLVVGPSNTLYFQNDTDVYAYKNGKHANHIIENASSLYNSSNNIVYIISENGVYIANSKKQPIKILGTD